VSDKYLIEAAMALRGAAGDEWVMFLEAMDNRAAEQTAKMADCTLDMLPRAQGMAVAVRELAKLFHEAPQLHQKAQERKRHG
jgi:hypothetical protein